MLASSCVLKEIQGTPSLQSLILLLDVGRTDCVVQISCSQECLRRCRLKEGEHSLSPKASWIQGSGYSLQNGSLLCIILHQLQVISDVLVAFATAKIADDELFEA